MTLEIILFEKFLRSNIAYYIIVKMFLSINAISKLIILHISSLLCMYYEA